MEMLGESGKRVYERREVDEEGGKKRNPRAEIERFLCGKYEPVGFVNGRMAFVEGHCK